MGRSANPREFLCPEESARVESVIAEAEQYTSAEIKLVIVSHCWTDIRAKAASIFKKQGLQNTVQRNCVLILVVTANREFLIYGDEGIHAKVGQGFWDEVRNEMLSFFAEARVGDALCAGIKRAGEKLKVFFPRQKEDRNEVPNEVAYEE